MKINRRNFFIRTFQAIAVVSIPAVFSSFLESCKNTPIGPDASQIMPTLSGTFSGGNVTLNVDSSSPLSKTGTAALVNYTDGSLLVDHPSGSVYNALSSICTHQGCQITGFDTGSEQFICPCHGSTFDVNGKVTQGPAGSPLTKYQTQLNGTQLTITVS
jgi:Rieske Fe-S protein